MRTLFIGLDGATFTLLDELTKGTPDKPRGDAVSVEDLCRRRAKQIVFNAESLDPACVGVA